MLKTKGNSIIFGGYWTNKSGLEIFVQAVTLKKKIGLPKLICTTGYFSSTQLKSWSKKGRASAHCPVTIETYEKVT